MKQLEHGSNTKRWIPYYDTCNVTALQQAQIFNYTWVSIISLINRNQLFNVILTSLLSSYHLIKISTQKYDICKSAPQIIEAWRAIAPVPFVCPTYPNKKKHYQILMNSVLHSMIIDTNRRLLTEPFYQPLFYLFVIGRVTEYPIRTRFAYFQQFRQTPLLNRHFCRYLFQKN